MLVLSRKWNEKLFIVDGDKKIEIVITEIQRHKVRIGITAPPSVKVLREELVGNGRDKS